MNTLKTVFLMTLVFVLFLFVGNLIGGATGMTFAFIMAIVMNFGSYWFSDKIVLKMYGARQPERSEYPRLFEMVERLSGRAGLPVPKVYVIDDDSPNAFATGRNPENAAVAFTTGIVRLLSAEELEGVAAHELAHIKNRDILTGTIVATLVGTITYIAQMAGWAAMFSRNDDEEGTSALESLVLMLIAPIAATLLQMAVSRSREFAADEDGARISGNAMYLASALNKLHQGVQRYPMGDERPATAHMFIVNPLSGGGITKLFSTHPPMEERIERLKKIAGVIA